MPAGRRRPGRPPARGRRGRPGLDVTAVLERSVELFIERGFDGTSMEDLAQHVGITKSAIYHHVPSKDALLGLALDRALSGLEDAAADTRAIDGPALDRVRAPPPPPPCGAGRRGPPLP